MNRGAPKRALLTLAECSLAAGSGPALITRNFDDYFAVAQAVVVRGRARLEKLRGKPAQVVTSAAFDSGRWGASYVQGLQMLWDAFVDGARATSHPHVVVHEVLPRLADNTATPAGLAPGSALGARPSSPAPSSTSGFRVSQKAARAAPLFTGGAVGGRGADQGASGGFADRAPAQPAPKPSKYKVAPSFTAPASSPAPPPRATPSFSAKGAGAQSSSGRVAGGNVGGGKGRPRAPTWAQPGAGAARQAHDGAASGGAQHEQHDASPTWRAAASGGWAVPSRRAGASSPPPPPPARSAPAWGGVDRGGVAGDMPTGSKPKVTIPSW